MNYQLELTQINNEHDRVTVFEFEGRVESIKGFATVYHDKKENTYMLMRYGNFLNTNKRITKEQKAKILESLVQIINK